VEEMNEELIKRWNERVKDKDQVVFLGDFAFGKLEDAMQIYSRLNGRIELFIRGNHDAIADKMNKLGCFTRYKEVELFRLGDVRIFCSHYHHYSWPESHYGVPHLYGHSHSKTKPFGNKFCCFDVGVDGNNYYPYSLDEVLAVFKLQKEVYEGGFCPQI
jgi:calcineurin-like phosphoesterase family protein